MTEFNTLAEEIDRYSAKIAEVEKQISDLKRQLKVDSDILKTMEKGLERLKEEV
jgi:uncharacterized protein YydD (DUF2326 family)